MEGKAVMELDYEGVDPTGTFCTLEDLLFNQPNKCIQEYVPIPEFSAAEFNWPSRPFDEAVRGIQQRLVTRRYGVELLLTDYEDGDSSDG